MAESEEVSSDGLTWTFKLRDGLKWHDGEKVTRQGLRREPRRWAKRDAMGTLILEAIQKELTAIDDRSFKWVLSKPIPKMLLALGKNNTPCCLHHAGAHRQDRRLPADHGIRRLRPDEVQQGRVGARAPRPCSRSSPTTCRAPSRSSWLSGGKKIYIDRLEWIIMPDAATASAAIQNGEIDWWEIVPTDLAPLLKKNKNISVDVADPLGNIGSFRFNYLHPPFNNVKARLAVLTALNQEDYMRALIGDDTAMWKMLPSFFTPGTSALHRSRRRHPQGPAQSRRRQEALLKLRAATRASRSPASSRRTSRSPRRFGDVTADLLKKIGFTVDFVATDWGTVGVRRAKKEPPGAAGGWGMFHTWHAGADCVNPAVYSAIRANADKAWFGWPNVPSVEKEVAAWYDAKNIDEEKAAVVRINTEAFANGVYAPTGFFQVYQAWRNNIDRCGPTARCRSSGT